MKLTSYPAGANSKKRKYVISDDHEAVLAVLNDLESAGVLLRYLRGAVCSKEETAKAMMIMRTVDRQRQS